MNNYGFNSIFILKGEVLYTVKRNWKIYYSSFSGPQKRAVELIYRELGKYILRDRGVYSFHSLSCETDGFKNDCNAIVLGTYNENTILQKYFDSSEIKENGYAVKVIDNPKNNEFKLVLLCGYSDTEVFYAAVDFVDDYLAAATPIFDAYIHLRNELFEHPLPDYYNSSAPAFKTRSIFTWGHPINDYKEYFENMARLKLNQVIIWNDHLPLNSDEIWRFYSAEWVENGKYAYELTKHIKEKTDGNVNMCMAGMFTGGIWFPTALCAEMFWNCNDDYSTLRKRVLNRNRIKF